MSEFEKILQEVIKVQSETTYCKFLITYNESKGMWAIQNVFGGKNLYNKNLFSLLKDSINEVKKIRDLNEKVNGATPKKYRIGTQLV